VQGPEEVDGLWAVGLVGTVVWTGAEAIADVSVEVVAGAAVQAHRQAEGGVARGVGCVHGVDDVEVGEDVEATRFR